MLVLKEDQVETAGQYLIQADLILERMDGCKRRLVAIAKQHRDAIEVIVKEITPESNEDFIRPRFRMIREHMVIMTQAQVKAKDVV